MTSYYAKPVPGSAALKTKAFDADLRLSEVERLEPGRLESRKIDDAILGRAVVREGFVPVLKRVFDELATQQTPIEQLLYLHLYRHSYGEERNFCRISRRALCKTTGFSLRRFNKALEGLVQKGHARLLQRDRNGTLYRVHLPEEIKGQRPGQEVLLGKVRSYEPPKQDAERPPSVRARAERAAPRSVQRAAQRSVQRSAQRSDNSHKVTSNRDDLTVGSVVERVLAALPPRQRKLSALDMLQDVTGLIEEGVELSALLHAAQRFAKLSRRRPEDFAPYARHLLDLDDQ